MDSAPVVLLTGASRGLGLATLEILLNNGVSVVAVSRTETPELTALADKYPGVLLISKGDVAVDSDNKAAVDVAMQSFGRLDALILNAGVAQPMIRIENLAEHMSAVQDLFNVNVVSFFSILAHALPYLKTADGKHGEEGDIKGRVIMVSSGAATGGTGAWGPYNASKAAVNGIARTLGSEEPSIVTVAVRPGTFVSNMQAGIRSEGAGHMSEKDHKKFMDLHESGSLKPPHVAGGVLAGLALKAPANISGQFIDFEDEKVASLRLD